MDQTWAQFEFGGAQLADRRQVRSLQGIGARLGETPHRSLTAACGPALRQAAHRVFEHPETTVDGLLAGHYERTAARCQERDLVLIAQDTCYFMYKQRQITGLATVNQQTKSRALIGHGALALTPDGTPLGLLDLDLWGADPDAPPRPPGKALPVEERESQKWSEALTAVTKRLSAPTGRALVLADREADITRYLTQPRPAWLHLLVRAAQNRVVYAESEAGAAERKYLFGVAAAAPVLGKHKVRVPRKQDQSQQILLPARDAVLEIRVQPLELRPRGRGKTPVRVWVIQALELDPPEGQEPIHWVLLSTEPVPDLGVACLMVRYYSRRWLIERLHFTLKSGLRAERLQIDDSTSLGHALAVYYVVAWRLLHLTYLAREEPEAPAAESLDPAEVEVLGLATKRDVRTIGAAVRAIAELGGWHHYRKAPPPGVKSLWIGWITLQGMVQGYKLALGRQPPSVMILD